MSIEDLLITIFGGTQGEYTLYEDDGKTVDYENDQSTSIRISHRRSGRTWKVRIDKPVGSYDGFISRKNIMLRIEGTVPAESVTVNGERVPFSFRPSDGNYWHYNGRTGSIDVALKQQELDDGLEIGLTLVDGKLESMQGWKGLMNRIELVSYYNTLATTFYVIHDEERLGVDLAQAGNRISRDPARYREEIERTRRRLKELPEVITSLRHHHAGEGDLRFAARRHPEKVQFCDKALSILEECTGSTAKASFDA